MLTVVMGYGDRIRHVETVTIQSSEWELYCKQMYIKHKSQEIYMMPASVTHWVKPTFRMRVSGQHMHPESVTLKRIPDEEVPKEIRIRHLMGAL